jgi:3-oxoacyl-[acyl-carrier protein] reductase
LCDVNIEKLTETAKEIADKKGVKTAPYKLDVSNSQEVEETINKILDNFNKIDILINNAGITRDTLLVRMSESDWDKVISINLKGSFLCTKAVAKHMMKQRSGKIVNVASIIGIIGNAGQSNYSASKAGVIGLTKSTAKELAGRNVNVNAVAPGFISTAMTDVLPEEVKNKMLEMIPLKRFGTAEDVANVVYFLVSEASSYLTGHVIEVDGGMVM